MMYALLLFVVAANGGINLGRRARSPAPLVDIRDHHRVHPDEDLPPPPSGPSPALNVPMGIDSFENKEAEFFHKQRDMNHRRANPLGADFKASFERLDLNKDGQLEFKELMSSYQPPSVVDSVDTDKESANLKIWKDIFEDMDVDHSKGIDLKEFKGAAFPQVDQVGNSYTDPDVFYATYMRRYLSGEKEL